MLLLLLQLSGFGFCLQDCFSIDGKVNYFVELSFSFYSLITFKDTFNQPHWALNSLLFALSLAVWAVPKNFAFTFFSFSLFSLWRSQYSSSSSSHLFDHRTLAYAFNHMWWQQQQAVGNQFSRWIPTTQHYFDLNCEAETEAKTASAAAAAIPPLINVSAYELVFFLCPHSFCHRLKEKKKGEKTELLGWNSFAFTW